MSSHGAKRKLCGWMVDAQPCETAAKPRETRAKRAKHPAKRPRNTRETCAKHSESCVNLMRIRVADPLHLGFWSLTGLAALQEGVEPKLVRDFHNANLAAIHAKRVTVMPRDMKVTRKIKEE